MQKNKVMILLEGHEEIAREGMELLESKNYDLYLPKNKIDQHIDTEAKECDAILVRGAVVDQSLIDSMPSLKVIARCGVGTDNIDIEAAAKKNIYVCNVPDANFTSVAEHVIGLLIGIAHQIVNADKAMRNGYFDARHRYMGTELTGKTIGIIGLGRIGQLVAKKCIYGFDMKVLAYDPYAGDMKVDDAITFVDTTDEIYKHADFITLHLPYIPLLHHFINEDVFKKMKKSAYIINCARGGLIDEVALANALAQGDIAGAGIDVFQSEPPEKDHVLWDEENVIVTPHMGASTKESLSRMAVGAVEEIIRVLNEEEPKNPVNKLA